MSSSHRGWPAAAIRRLHDERHRVGPTPLRRLPLPDGAGTVHLKDESAHPTGTLKHRLVRALFCHAVSGGGIDRGTPVVTATGGPVAVAVAYFARLLELPCTAVVRSRTPAAVLDRITEHGATWQPAEQPPAALQQEAREVADRQGGHFLDHFAHAEAAVAACGEPTIATELFEQYAAEGPGAGEDGAALPDWIVTGAGTGATSATVGRHLRYHGLPTRLAVADPEHSAYFPAWASGARDYATGRPSRVPGIGRPRTEPGFLPGVLDLVIPVPDAASVAAFHWVRSRADIPAGPATGTVVWAAGKVLDRARATGRPARVVGVMGDTTESGRATFLSPRWLTEQGIEPAEYDGELVRLLTGDAGHEGREGGHRSGGDARPSAG